MTFFFSRADSLFFLMQDSFFTFYPIFPLSLYTSGITAYTYFSTYCLRIAHNYFYIAYSNTSPSNQPMLASRQRRVKYLVLLILLIHASNSVRDRTKLHRCALLSHHESPWIKLYRHGDASSFLNMTGLTRHAFSLLHDVLFVGQQPQRRGRGRPQLMESTAQLGLFLFYVGSTMGMKHLCMIFGITPSTCSEIINKMLPLVVCKLKRHPMAAV